MTDFSIRMGELVKDSEGEAYLKEALADPEEAKFQASMSPVDQAVYRFSIIYWQTPITTTVAGYSKQMLAEDLMFVWSELAEFLANTASGQAGSYIWLGEWLPETPSLRVSAIAPESLDVTVELRDFADDEEPAATVTISMPDFIAQWVFFVSGFHTTLSKLGYVEKDMKMSGTFAMLKKFMRK